MIHLSTHSRMYLRVRVDHRNRPSDDPPLESVTVEFAFTENPAEEDWHGGGWERDGRLYARVLVGPGGVATLAPGLRPVLLRVGDNPERPVLRAGHVMVY